MRANVTIKCSTCRTPIEYQHDTKEGEFPIGSDELPEVGMTAEGFVCKNDEQACSDLFEVVEVSPKEDFEVNDGE
jgi:hypothetical protein